MAWALVATPAAAKSPTFYQACDGYGSPSKTGDGMTKEATGLFGLVATLGSSGNTRRSTPVLGAAGVAACDEAIGDARLVSKHWLRKASLLRGRAIHNLAAGNDAQALRDLDAAEAAVVTRDAFYQRSFGLGTDLVRAYALRKSGDDARARAAVAAAREQRPFNRQIALASLAILGDDKPGPDVQSVQWQLARLEPRAVDTIFVDAFNKRDWAQVLALHPQLVLPLPTADIGTSGLVARIQEARGAASELLFAAERRGRKAYALAALGRHDDARAELTAARAALAAGTPARQEAPATGVKEKRKAGDKRLVNNLVSAYGTEGGKFIDAWSKLVETRIALAAGPAPQSLEALFDPAVPANGAQLDLLLAAKAKAPGMPGLAEAQAAVEAKLVRPASDRADEVKLLFASLPHAEIPQRAAGYKKAPSAFMGALWGGVSGFKTEAKPADGTTAISFTGEKSSATVVEEMALLRAAELAREQGKTGLVIRSRKDYERTQNTYYYSTMVRSDPIGYSTHLVAEFVDKAAPPQAYRAVPWRVLDVAAIIAALGPTYMPSPQQSAAGN